MIFGHEIVKFLPFGITHGTFNVKKIDSSFKIKGKYVFKSFSRLIFVTYEVIAPFAVMRDCGEIGQ